MDENVTASFLKNKKTTLERIEKYLSPTYFTDVNLYGRLYPAKKEIQNILHWEVPGGEGAWQSWNIDDIMKQKFTPIKVGESFGPLWGTHWFKLELQVPDEWAGKEVRLQWRSQSEAMVWNSSGEPLQGLSTGTFYQPRPDFTLSKNWKPDSTPQVYFIEMACSTMFGAGKNGMINPPDVSKKFTLEAVQLNVFDYEIYSLYVDLNVMHDLAKHLPDDQRGYRALYAGNHMINEIVKGNIVNAQAISKEFFSKRNGEMSLTLALIGNCHIDTAWLWPYSETKRKCARSWSSTIRLMEDYPSMVFACSQAQQFAWLKEYYPTLFSKLKEKIKENRFVPVGSTWVEMDGLIPSGESFMRQFLYGQKFYSQEFGKPCNEFWLPDTFGYSAQIPQICQQFDISRFLTQKLSWSLVNKFPNHTFIWEGIDGSSILAHFPPGDSYTMSVKVEEALKTEKNLQDKGRVSIAGFLYGYGDGGGGPTQDMLERAERLKDVDGCPKLEHMTPDEMFTRMEKEERNLIRWVGELYLELHNGTYTSQAQTKRQNRECELALRRSEILLSMVAYFQLGTSSDIEKYRNMCEGAWKNVLLNQFHDVLPGSSIGIVYNDSDKLYRSALATAKTVEQNCFKLLNKDSPKEESASIFNFMSWNSSENPTDDAKLTVAVTNYLPWKVQKVISLESANEDTSVLIGNENVLSQTSSTGKHFLAIEVPPLSHSSLNITSSDSKNLIGDSLNLNLTGARILSPPAIKVEIKDDLTILENMHIIAHFSSCGEIIKLFDKKDESRDIFERMSDKSRGTGNIITLYDDIPLFWDAWDVMDYHLETRKVLNSKENVNNIDKLKIVEEGPLKVVMEWVLIISDKSILRQKIIMTAVDPFVTFETKASWHENHKFLKVEFETGLLARKAIFDIQFGHVERPTHINTSWDSARFETCGHKWAEISEYDCGLAVLNDSKYGWSSRNSKLCLSLLRAPKAPDDMCDMGEHFFKYAVMPHKGSFQEGRVIEASYEFNCPLSLSRDSPKDIIEAANWLEIMGEGVMLEAVKVSEESTSNIILRLYEMYGGTSKISLKLRKNIGLKSVEDCNGMESVRTKLPIDDIPVEEEDSRSESAIYVSVPLQFTPFQIRTVKLSF